MLLLQAARLSRLRDDSTGLEKQDLECQQYASLGGHEIIGVAPDTDVSGDTDPWERPELGSWLKRGLVAPDGRRAEGIIASHVDRLARSTVHFMRLLHWADENNVRIITTGEQGVDFSTPMGKLLGYIISWLGEQELAAITRRNRSTQQWLKDNGYLHGKPPFGFLVVDKGNHKTLKPDDDLAEVIREIADRYLTGATLTELAEWLDAKGVKPASSDMWAQGSIRKVLGNTALIGRRKDAQGRTILRFDPILDEVTFRRVQAELARRAKPRGAPSDESLLSGIIYCANCGAAMGFHKAYTKLAGGGRAYHFYYRCHRTARRPSRCKNMITVEFADEGMSEWVTNVIGAQKLIVREIIPGRGHDEDIADIDAETAALDKDADDYDRRHSELRAERKRLKELPPVPTEVKEVSSGLTVREFWESMDSTEVKREWLKAGQVKVLAYKPPVKGAAPEGAPPFTFSIEALFGRDWSIAGRWTGGTD